MSEARNDAVGLLNSRRAIRAIKPHWMIKSAA